MVNNFTNNNKPNKYLSPQISEHLKDHDIWRWKIGPDLGQAFISVDQLELLKIIWLYIYIFCINVQLYHDSLKVPKG